MQVYKYIVCWKNQNGGTWQKFMTIEEAVVLYNKLTNTADATSVTLAKIL